MYRNFTKLHSRLLTAAALAFSASAALADDSSMSVLTGESYAYFNNLDYAAGRFNVARGAQSTDRGLASTLLQSPRDGVATKTSQAPQRDGAMKMPSMAGAAADKPIVLADRPRISPLTPFRDDQGA